MGRPLGCLLPKAGKGGGRAGVVKGRSRILLLSCMGCVLAGLASRLASLACADVIRGA